MTRYEYKIVPSSTRPPKIKGVRDASERMRRGLEDLLNGLADQGWEYLRRDSMTVESRTGLLRRKEVVEETVLIFRREIALSLADSAAAEGAPVQRARPFMRPVTAADDAPDIDAAAPDGRWTAPDRPAPNDDAADPDAQRGAERPAAIGDRPTGAQPLFARRIEAAREALRAQAAPPLTARRRDDDA